MYLIILLTLLAGHTVHEASSASLGNVSQISNTTTVPEHFEAYDIYIIDLSDNSAWDDVDEFGTNETMDAAHQTSEDSWHKPEFIAIDMEHEDRMMEVSHLTTYDSTDDELVYEPDSTMEESIHMESES